MDIVTFYCDKCGRQFQMCSDKKAPAKFVCIKCKLKGKGK